MHRRVVVTGLGVISPLGNDAETFWQQLLAGRSGIGPVRAFDTREYEIHVGAEAWDFESPDRTTRCLAMALVASREALAQAGFAPDEAGAMGVALGTTVGEGDAFEALNAFALTQALTEAPAAWLDRFPAAHLAADLAAAVGAAGPVNLFPTACSAGNYALGHAWDLLRTGAVEVMLAGGADPFSQNVFTGFHHLRNLAPDHPRPFSAGRIGLTLAEGAGMLVLETLDHCLARGARPLAEILGFGLSCDANHRIAPDPEGMGASRAMWQALAEAGLAPEAIDHVSAHGTGTVLNDKIETLAIHRVFGARTATLPVVALKGALGHTLGAASALEAIACVRALGAQCLPPTLHAALDDPECALDLRGASRDLPLRVVMNNSYAFGGNNACMILGLPPEVACES